MSIVNPLKLMAIGGSLVTSTSIWLFDSKTTQVTKVKAKTPYTGNINAFTAVAKLPNRNENIIKVTNLTFTTHSKNHGSYFHITGQSEEPKKYMSVIQAEQDRFQIGHISTTRQQYLDLSKEDININLYTKPAWESETNRDEYSTPVTKEEITELFSENLDEVMIKQLLLSLANRLEWMKQDNVLTYSSYYSQYTWPNNLDELKNLKIKHFKDFTSLKSYVHEKVKTCTNEREICIPTVGELDVLETDKKSFLENIWKNAE